MDKKTKGRKRHIAVDALGLLLVVLITAASIQDSAGGMQALDGLAAAHGIDVEVIRRDTDVNGF